MKETIIGVILTAVMGGFGWFGSTLYDVSVHAAANNERINQLVVDVESLGEDVDVIKQELVTQKELASR